MENLRELKGTRGNSREFKGTQGNSRELKGTQGNSTKGNKGSQGLPRWLPREKFSPKGTNIFRKKTKIFSKRNKSCQKIVTNAKFGGKGGRKVEEK